MTNNLSHVIVEGPDGSGKDTLIKSLLELLPFHTLHERASTSLGGPVPNLAAWVAQDVRNMPGSKPSIYNRHPLISELIYHPYREGSRRGYASPEFSHAAWRNAMRKQASQHAIVVFCQPPYHVLRRTVLNQGPAAHMPGVFENILGIYTDYATHLWPGINIRYDYTNDTAENVASKITYALLHGKV